MLALLKSLVGAIVGLSVSSCGGKLAPLTTEAGLTSSPSNTSSLHSETTSNDTSLKRTPGKELAKARPLPRPQVRLLHPRKPYPWLGLRLRPLAPGGHPLSVASVQPGSPADKAGLAKGDQLLKLNESSLNSSQELRNFMRAAQVQQHLQFEVMRAGRVIQLEVMLEGMPDDEDRARMALLGRLAPELAGAVTYQGEISSMREAKGKVVLLDFWASYCGACLELLPEVEAVSRRYAAQGLEVVGVTVDPSRRGREIAREYQLTYTLMSDLHAQVVNRYNAQTIPMLVLINQEGVVEDVMIGSQPERIEALMRRLKLLLAKN